MKRHAIVIVVTTILTACVSLAPPSTPGNMRATPAAFQNPGIFSNTIPISGTVTFLLRANGRGLSCHRSVAGNLFLGDVVYTGRTLETEDGRIAVESVTADEIRIDLYGTKASLPRVAVSPTVCREFFEKNQ